MTINTTKIADESKAREMIRGIAAGVRFYKYANGHYPASLTDVQPYADDWWDTIEGGGNREWSIRLLPMPEGTDNFMLEASPKEGYIGKTFRFTKTGKVMEAPLVGKAASDNSTMMYLSKSDPAKRHKEHSGANNKTGARKMSRAVKEAGAVGDFVAANKVPIATGATAMALAALLSKRNRLAKALGWGAVGAGLGKAGQLYLDAYKRPEGSVPDYLKRQPAKAQEPVLNTDLPGVSPRIQAAATAAKLPTREDRQKAREKELAALQSEGFGSRFLKDMATGTGEALKERAASAVAPAVGLYNKAKGDIDALNKAGGHNKEAEKNIRRMRDELEAQNAPRRKETLLDRVMRRLSK